MGSPVVFSEPEDVHQIRLRAAPLFAAKGAPRQRISGPGDVRRCSIPAAGQGGHVFFAPDFARLHHIICFICWWISFRETNLLSLSDPPTDIPSDIYSDILSHIYIPLYSDILSDILAFYLTFYLAYTLSLSGMPSGPCPRHELLGDYFSWRFHESCPHHGTRRRTAEQGRTGRSEGVAPVNLETLTWQVVAWNMLKFRFWCLVSHGFPMKYAQTSKVQ